jgi:hypothetical protein
VLPPGASTLEVTLTDHEGGTLVRVLHRDLPLMEAAKHAIGWQHFLPRQPGIAKHNFQHALAFLPTYDS